MLLRHQGRQRTGKCHGRRFADDVLRAAIAGGRSRQGGRVLSRVLGFAFGPPWGGFYAIGRCDGFEIHLKCAPKTAEDRANRHQHDHLDVYAGVEGVDALYEACQGKGATILKPLATWGTKDFYLEDPDGYIIAFGEVVHAAAAAP